MTFTFDPEHPDLRALFPPVAGYPYFQGGPGFEPSATDYSPANAWLLAEIALLAYAPLDEVRSLIEAQDDSSPLRGFQFQAVGDSGDHGCFILQDQRCVIVAFRGTRVPGLADPLAFLQSLQPNLQDVITDLRFLPAPFLDGQVYSGFLDAYRQITRDLRAAIGHLPGSPGRPMWFTGHSLGGALATLAAAEYGEFERLYTFGCPGVGDTKFASPFKGNNCFRVVHHDDFVTRLPPPFVPVLPRISYTSVGRLVYIERGGDVRLDVNPNSLMDVFKGIIDWQDVLQSITGGVESFLDNITGRLPTSLQEVRVPPGPIEEHAPIYYATYLKKTLAG